MHSFFIGSERKLRKTGSGGRRAGDEKKMVRKLRGAPRYLILKNKSNPFFNRCSCKEYKKYFIVIEIDTCGRNSVVEC